MGIRNIILYFLLLCSTFFIAEAVLAAMSVDLGAQFIKIGLVKPGVPMEIVLNKESHRKTPNIISIRNGERFFADSAAQMGIKHPPNTYSYFVDLIGKKFDNPIVERYRKNFPHLKLQADDVRGTVLFETDNGTYSVETLLAMVLWNAKEMTEAFAGQPVKDVLITIPAFFNQAERKAVTTAVEIAGLNLLQLLSDGLAAGLNYGVFRRKEITEQSQTLLVYDIGATKTRATILEYRLAKEKNSNEQNPIMVPLGIGFDRTLGGLDITLKLRDHLLTEFKKQHKTQKDITENPRAMAKLFKEAERVKQVLSANVDHYAQIESLFEDKDFKVKITRDHLEGLVKDMENKYLQPILDALKMAELSIDQVNQIVLMGAGTRMPKLQQLVQEFAKSKEISKFLNTDEAIAIGAVYQAAALSKGFKVKKFAVQELQLYPIQVDFISHISDSEDETKPKTEKKIHRTIYSYKSLYPTSKKIISFTSHTDDFKFNVNYGPLTYLSEKQLNEFGYLNISEVKVNGVADAYKLNVIDENTVFKGVKAHFHTDLFGIVRVERAELIVEEKEQPSNSTFSNIMGKIGSFFSKSKDEEKDQVSDDSTKEDSKEETPKEEKPTSKPVEKTDTTESFSTNTTADNTTDTANQTSDSASKNETLESSKNATKKEEIKLKVNKVALKLDEELLDSTLTSIDTKAASSQLKAFEKNEKAKTERDAALNSLEATVYDIASKLEEELFVKYGTEEELTTIRETKDKISTWLEDEVNPETPTSDIKDRKKELDATIKKLKSRKRQHEERPKHLESMSKLLNDSEATFTMLRNLTELFSEAELSMLEKVLTETKEWFGNKTTEQDKLQLNQDPAFTVGDIQDKAKTLEREVKYLFSKMYSAKLKAEKEALRKAKEAEKNKTKEGKVEEKIEDSEKESDEKESAEEKIDKKESVEKSESEQETNDGTTESHTEDIKIDDKGKDDSAKEHDPSEL